ncbi:MAG: FGGY family carbohydrate kinase [Mesotoga sp.]|uniref:xylulokinase n=1 Tax=Mesotoga sp. TaxID=2053577 RepID=UPI002604339B|nr:FGGY family carbohydrate kinase [Mesotoga sp.]MDD4826131.1 FGGY family carbohydrate kinase [Mesotoga sp.]MDD5683742.1 FGGY family carbohydrate kinase [Mesotoga sp.]
MYLGVDMGTSSIKATLLDEKGNIAVRSRVESVVVSPEEGSFEVEAEKNWWLGFRKALESICIDNDVKRIKALCISSVCGTFVPVDNELRPLYNAILYGIDTRATDQIERLNSSFGKEYLKNHLGGEFTTHSVIPKTLWLKENRQEIYEKTFRFVESNNFVSGRLTGKTAWDFPTAAGTRLLDFVTQGLPREIIRKAGLDENKFPGLSWPLSIVGRVKASSSRETGLKEGIPVVAGACDINGEAMACGGINPGDLVVVFGSTTSTLFTTKGFHLLDGFAPGVSILEGTYRLGAATSSGGRFVGWIKDLLQSEITGEKDEGPTGIIILPYIDGARAPYDNPSARGVIFGLQKTDDRNKIFKASLESLGYEIDLLIRKLETVSDVPNNIHVLGGMAASRLLLQIVANITGREIHVHGDIDASYGDAIMAMTADHDYSDIAKLDSVKEQRGKAIRISPDLELHSKYRVFSQKFETLYSSVKDIF